MNCPDCEQEKQCDNFCSNCGNALRQKCSECEKMEPINRPVCKSKLKEATDALGGFIEEKVGDWRYSLCVAFFMIICLAILFFLILTIENMVYVSLIMIPVIVVLTFLLSFYFTKEKSWQNNAAKKARKEFLSKNPEYAKIIKESENSKISEED